MLEKLQTLEAQIQTLTQNYHVALTDLANLKNKPNNDAKNEATILALGQKLTQAQDDCKTLTTQVQNLTKQLDASLADIDSLQADNANLSEMVTALQEKNRLAIERAELVKDWLVNIDNARSE